MSATTRRPESMLERVRAAISNAYYDARNDGRTMEYAADDASGRVMQIVNERIEALQAEHAEEMRDAGAELREITRELGLAQREAEQW